MILTVNEQTSRLSNLLIELEEVGVEFPELLKHDLEFVGLRQDGGSEKERERGGGHIGFKSLEIARA